MSQAITLKAARFPRIVSDLMHSNQFLKIFSVASLVVSALSVLGLLLTTNRPPLILTMSASGESIPRIDSASAEDQIKAAVNRYISLRYLWSPEDVKANLAAAKVFVPPKSIKAFESSTSQVAIFSKDRSVTQRVYPSKMEVSLKDSTVTVLGDRVTSVQGLKAAGDLKLKLTFQSGERTIENPWGIYIIKEMEE